MFASAQADGQVLFSMTNARPYGLGQERPIGDDRQAIYHAIENGGGSSPLELLSAGWPQLNSEKQGTPSFSRI